jgi:hypothetical protein
MSRTDKDRPRQIRAEDLTGSYSGAYYDHDSPHHYRDGGCGEHCGWTLPYSKLCSAPRWFRHDVWVGPERGRERDELRGFAREYNAGHRPDDEHDYDFANYQHRHLAEWLWCW